MVPKSECIYYVAGVWSVWMRCTVRGAGETSSEAPSDVETQTDEVKTTVCYMYVIKNTITPSCPG